jgi:hypothetical protein
MIICPKCSFDNELGRIFCHQCGNKLDLDKIKHTSGPGRIVHRKKSGPRRPWRIAIEVVILALFIWMIYLMTRTPEIKPLKPTNADLVATDNKRVSLERVVYQGKPLAAPYQLKITTSELNTYLNSKGWDKPPKQGFNVVPVALRIELNNGVVTLSFLGTARWGEGLSKKIFLSYTGLPSIQDGRFEFAPIAASIGDLPIHPMILAHTGLIQHYFQQLLSKLKGEKELLDQLSSITVERDDILLVYQSKNNKPAPAGR